MPHIRLICLVILVINAEVKFNNLTHSAVLNSQIYQLDSVIKTMDLPSAAGAMSPRLDSDGSRLLLSWLEPYKDAKATLNGTASQFKWSRLENNTWSEPVTVISTTRMFTNSADIPSVVASHDGSYYAHWLEKSSTKRYGYDVQLASAQGNHHSFKSLGKIWNRSNSVRNGYDGFVSMIPGQKGIRAFWIDGRLYNEKAGEPMRLMTAEISDSVNKETVLDDDICSCCDTTAVNTSAGPVVFYRGRTKEEIRDILTVRLTDKGWSSPTPIADDNWHIAGCAVNGPKADAIGNHIAVSWFTGAKGKGDIRVVFSEDAGKTFSVARDIDAVSHNGALGKVDIVLLDEGQALVSWIGRAVDKDTEVIYVRRINSKGILGPYVKIAELKNSRRAGVPQMERVGNTVYLVWTVPSINNSINNEHEKVRGLKMVKLALKDIPAVEPL